MARRKRRTSKRPARKTRKRVAKTTKLSQATSQGFEVPRGSGRPTTRAAIQSTLPEDFHALYDSGFRAARGIVPTVSPQRDLLDIPDWQQRFQTSKLITIRRHSFRIALSVGTQPRD